MNVADVDVSSDIERIKGSDGCIGGKRSYGSRETAKAGRDQKLLAKGGPDVIEVTTDDDGCLMVESYEGMAIKEFAELYLSLHSRQAQV